jgi:hypothetical protein
MCRGNKSKSIEVKMKITGTADTGCCLLIIAWVIIYLVFHFCTWTNKPQAYKVLHQQGYDHIIITGHSYFTCSGSDWSSTGFTAYKNNQKIKGSVCCGLFFKNCTIRYK